MRKRLVVAAVILASIGGLAAAESREPADVDGMLAPPALLPTRPPADSLSARLVWVDPMRAAVGVDGLARDEVRSLLRRMGVSVSWRRGEASEVARPGEVRVILLDRSADQAPDTPILGATPRRFEGPPFLWVHVPSVRAAVGLRRAGPAAVVEPMSMRALGIALGRVVAHELVHALAPSVPHGTGLMSVKLTRRHLAAATLPVDPAVGLAVCAALRGEPSLPPSGTATIAAAVAGR